jgi:iron complex outermembrane receptor protein
LEWQVQATRYWTLLGAVGLLDTDIKAIDPSLTVPVERGNRTPKTQKSTFSLGSQLEIPLGSLTGTIRVDYGRWGKKYWHPDNVDIRDPVNMLDLRVSIGNERWTATAWGRNVLDEFYWQDFNAVEFGAPGVDLGSPSSPDTYGIDLKYRF